MFVPNLGLSVTELSIGVVETYRTTTKKVPDRKVTINRQFHFKAELLRQPCGFCQSQSGIITASQGGIVGGNR